MSYRPRIVDRELELHLQAMGAVVIEGPKGCGKTETARQHASSEVLLDVDTNAYEAAVIDPSLILGGKNPRLIDEWQLVPQVWNSVRRDIDDRKGKGLFILTGSAVPADDITRHTGAGRISRMRMRPMSLFEVGVSTGEISLGQLFLGEEVRAASADLGIADIAELIARGGWPGHSDLKMPLIGVANTGYVEEIRRTDISRVDGKKRDPELVGRLIQSLSRHFGSYASASTIAKDVGDSDESISDDTARDYIAALTRLMVVEDLPAWSVHLRSKSALRSGAKRYLVDPSLAVAALAATPDRLLQDLNFMGHLFEGLVVRDMRVYAQLHDATVKQYRDNTGLEVDMIVERRDGAWMAFEIKMGGAQIEDAAKSLKRFFERVDVSRCGEPAMLGVITATGYCYTRPDGIAVIPIGCLGA